MKVAVDANVLLSALATRGMCMELLAELHRDHEVIVPACVLQEVSRHLTAKFRIPPEVAADRVAWLRSWVAVVSDAEPTQAWSRDPDDDRVIAAALAAEARAIVTGDRDLLDLGQVGVVAMVAPRDWRFFVDRRL